MKTIIFSTLAVLTAAFSPQSAKKTKTSTRLDLNRREFGAAAATLGFLGGLPAIANAKPASTWFWDEQIENVHEPAQQATDGRLDLNSAFVGEYMSLPGMFPHAAGKIASNGPYKSVRDVYKIPGLTDQDRELFKKYEKYFTVNPPGRAFDERINARVST